MTSHTLYDRPLIGSTMTFFHHCHAIFTFVCGSRLIHSWYKVWNLHFDSFLFLLENKSNAKAWLSFSHQCRCQTYTTLTTRQSIPVHHYFNLSTMVSSSCTMYTKPIYFIVKGSPKLICTTHCWSLFLLSFCFIDAFWFTYIR